MTFDPSALQFYVLSKWDARDDNAETIGHQLVIYVDRLTAIDPLLQNWRFGRMGATSEATVRKAPAAHVRANIMIGEDGQPDPEDGFTLIGLTGVERQEFAFSGTVGRLYRFPRANDIYFHTNSNHAADPAIVTYTLMKGVVLATIAVWTPGFCSAYSSDLKPIIAEGLWHSAWMTYVPPAEAGGIDLVGVPFSEWTPDGGLLLSATEETFDAANPDHVAGARRLHEATRHLNPPSDFEDWDDDEDDLPGETID